MAGSKTCLNISLLDFRAFGSKLISGGAALGVKGPSGASGVDDLRDLLTCIEGGCRLELSIDVLLFLAIMGGEGFERFRIGGALFI